MKLERARSMGILKALADETRYEILEFVSASTRPVSVIEVADELGLHPNTVRPHLERLREVGFLDLVIRSDGKVGRPQHLYRASEEAPSIGLNEGSPKAVVEFLAMTLSELIERLRISPSDAREMGRAWGRQVRNFGERPTGDAQQTGEEFPVEALLDDLASLGFEPSGSEEIIFNACPFRELAEEYPEIVCSAHRGICEGSLESTGGSVSAFNDLDATEPCRVSVAV